jgi:hypothetical protein
MPFWNVDLSIKKSVMITERFYVEFTTNFANVFNHNQLSDPNLVLGDKSDWGALGSLSGVQFTGQAQANNSRAIQFGLRLSFCLRAPNGLAERDSTTARRGESCTRSLPSLATPSSTYSKVATPA